MNSSLRTFLFCLPLGVLFGPPALALWLGGEFIRPAQVVERLSARDHLVLHGPAYTNSAIYTKLHMLTERAPQIAALGTSRVMQFRAGFFDRSATFYNAGGSIARILHFRAFLRHVPREQQPQVLILGIDAYLFNRGFDNLEKDELDVNWLDAQMTTRPSPTEIFFNNWWTVWRDIKSGKMVWSRLTTFRGLHDRIGLNAVCRGQGFRNDGSYLYSPSAGDVTNPANRDYQFAETLGRIAQGKGRFVYGHTISPGAVTELKALLDECRDRGIQVVGFLPPHAHAVWTALTERGEKYDYLWKLPATLRPLFEQRGFEFYDFSDFAWIGAADEEAVDGFHGSEKTYLRLTMAMLQQGSFLNRYTRLSRLEALLATARGNTSLVPDVF